MQKTKDGATGNLQNTGGELRCSGRLSISSSNSGILPVSHVKNQGFVVELVIRLTR